MVLAVKNLPVSAGNLRDAGWILGREDPLEEGIATHFSILGWRILWTEEPGGLQSMGSQAVRCNWTDLACTHVHESLQSLSPSYQVIRNLISAITVILTEWTREPEFYAAPGSRDVSLAIEFHLWYLQLRHPQSQTTWSLLILAPLLPLLFIYF